MASSTRASRVAISWRARATRSQLPGPRPDTDRLNVAVDAVIVGLAAVFGLAIGSFLNVVVYRVPRGLSLSSPPSACPSCGHPIRWRDNVPVLSWLLLGGRCRDCRSTVSVRYPLIEAATAIAFAAVAFAIVTLAG
jgi:leader peptidase (prepilin peptidase) / N-methyltransferase